MKKILTAVLAATFASASINAAVADDALQTQTQQKLMIHATDGTAAGTGTMTQTKTQTKTMSKLGEGSSSQLKKQYKKGKK